MTINCGAEAGDCGHTHHDKCYCNEDQGTGYTYSDEYGDCDFCQGKFPEGTVICADKYNVSRKCPSTMEIN